MYCEFVDSGNSDQGLRFVFATGTSFCSGAVFENDIEILFAKIHMLSEVDHPRS